MRALSERFGNLWRSAPSALGGRLSERESPSARKGARLPGGESQVANVKASKAGPLIAYDTLGQPVWSPRDYGAFAREGFMQNAIVYRSVRMIAEAAASIPLLLYADAEEIETHPLLDLIRKPSADHTGTDFLEAWFGFLLVSGNAYVEAVAIDGQIRELHNLRPDRMKVLPGLDGWPEGYEYTAGGTSVRFTSEPVEGVRPILHTRLFHPANDHYGMSPIEAAATAIDIHNTASGWNKALLDNSARPSGALVYAASNGQMTDEQFARLKSELETNYQGASHAGRPLLLEGGLDWKPLSLSPKDMDFIEAKNAAAREIALAVGVPPMLLGIPGDNTFANYAEAQRAFWRQTVLPLANRMCAAFSTWLSPAFAGVLDGGESANANARLRESSSANVRLDLRPDLDQVEALNPEREALWSRLQNVTFLTDDEKRAAAGYAALGGRLSERESPSAKYRGDQPRVPAGNSDGGQWTSDGGGGGGGDDDGVQLAQARGGPNSPRIREFPAATPAQLIRLDAANSRARASLSKVRELDPNWRPTPSLRETVEGAISAAEAEAVQAEARLAHILRDAIPNTNPSWGVNRLVKELHDRGFVYQRSTSGDGGRIYSNPKTHERVRIMPKPPHRYRADTDQKHNNDFYYRYTPGKSKAPGAHITIPNKLRLEGKE